MQNHRSNEKSQINRIPAVFCLIVGLLTSYSAAGGADSIIIDHSSTNADVIPDYWIDQVRQQHMLVQYIGASHSRQMINGLELLKIQSPRYQVQISSDLTLLTETDCLWVLDGKYTVYGWSEGADDVYWSTEQGRQITENTAIEADTQDDPYIVSIWAWCWDICRPWSFFSQSDEFNDTHMGWYADALAGFNSNPVINQTTFVYHTSITDCSDYLNPDGPWRVTHYNEVIRQVAMANNGILFDQADIENWNYDNTTQRVETDYADRTVYLRHSDYSESNEPDTYTDDHANDELCLRKAKALWWLLARLAGWNGCPALLSDLNGDCQVDMLDMEVMAQQWGQTSCALPNWCDGADLNHDHTINLDDFTLLAENWLVGPP